MPAARHLSGEVTVLGVFDPAGEESVALTAVRLPSSLAAWRGRSAPSGAWRTTGDASSRMRSCRR